VSVYLIEFCDKKEYNSIMDDHRLGRLAIDQRGSKRKWKHLHRSTAEAGEVRDVSRLYDGSKKRQLWRVKWMRPPGSFGAAVAPRL
jgi:hypothetical protein